MAQLVGLIVTDDDQFKKHFGRLLRASAIPISVIDERAVRDTTPPEIMHKNLHRVVYVLGDVAGRQESPVYAIAALRPRVDSLVTPDGGHAH